MLETWFFKRKFLNLYSSWTYTADETYNIYATQVVIKVVKSNLCLDYLLLSWYKF